MDQLLALGHNLADLQARVFSTFGAAASLASAPIRPNGYLPIATWLATFSSLFLLLLLASILLLGLFSRRFAPGQLPIRLPHPIAVFFLANAVLWGLHFAQMPFPVPDALTIGDLGLDGRPDSLFSFALDAVAAHLGFHGPTVPFAVLMGLCGSLAVAGVLFGVFLGLVFLVCHAASFSVFSALLPHLRAYPRVWEYNEALVVLWLYLAPLLAAYLLTKRAARLRGLVLALAAAVAAPSVAPQMASWLPGMAQVSDALVLHMSYSSSYADHAHSYAATVCSALGIRAQDACLGFAAGLGTLAVIVATFVLFRHLRRELVTLSTVLYAAAVLHRHAGSLVADKLVSWVGLYALTPLQLSYVECALWLVYIAVHYAVQRTVVRKIVDGLGLQF